MSAGLRKGFVFSLDALMAALIIVGGLILLGRLIETHTDTMQISAASEDTLASLSNMQIKDIKDNWVKNNIINGTIPDENVTVLEQIGFFWAVGRQAEAQRLAELFLNNSYTGYGERLTFDGVPVYQRNATKGARDVLVSNRLISGIAQGQAVTGSSASAYLRHIKNKRNALFLPFGGFVGEGNVSVRTDALPADANVTDIVIELDTDQNFWLLVNGHQCDYLLPTGNRLVPTSWSRANCTGYLSPGGVNVIGFNSSGVLNGSAIYGGYVKILYTTNQFNDFNVSSMVYRFPEIDGLINLYDGFYVGGTINAMNISLNFTSNYTTYLTIGNASFTFPGSNVSQNFTITDAQIQGALFVAGLSYANISRKTIPLRFGIGNVLINGNPADVMVVSDTSGSMAWCITNDNPTPCPPGDTTKIISAKNVTTNFVSTLLNGTSGMRVGLTEFSTTIKSWTNLTTNLTTLTNQISTYAATDSTCICCGINNATDTLTLDGQIILVQRGSSGWKYNDSNVAPPGGWNTSSFSNTSWKDGTTNMGWGYAGQSTTIANHYQGSYYERKWFNITDASQIVEAKLYVYSDDGADVYINGVRVDNNYGNTVSNGVYWNRNGISVNPSVLVTGSNLIAVRQYHRSTPDRMGFDLSLVANTKGSSTGTQRKNIVVMTDGEANVQCSRQNTGDAKDDAIKAACDAYTNYGIIVYTVGFGMGADNATLQSIANCTTGQFFSAQNNTALQNAFNAIGNTIIQASSTQTAITTGNVTRTALYASSVINADYTPDIVPPQPNEISVTLQTPPLQTCSASVPLYSGMRFLDSKVYSYSGDSWTATVMMNNVSVYNLTSYSSIYTSLGDPYQVAVPSSLLFAGNNSVAVTIAIDGTNVTNNCSSNNTFVYTASINLSTERSTVVPNASGCKWSVAFQGGSVMNMTIPSSYNGSAVCSYQPGNITYNANDAYQLGAYTIFNRLDFKRDGTLFVDLSADDLEVIVTTINKVPYLWGPSVVTLEVSR